MKRIRRCFFLAASPLCSVLIALHFLRKINIPLGAEQSTTGETNLAVAKIESSVLGDKSFFFQKWNENLLDNCGNDGVFLQNCWQGVAVIVRRNWFAHLHQIFIMPGNT